LTRVFGFASHDKSYWGEYEEPILPFCFTIATVSCLSLSHELINYVNTIAKCRHLKKITCKGTLQQMFIYLSPHLLLGFCLGWCSNFVGSEYGQIQSGQLLQNMVSNRTQHPPPPPSNTLYLNTRTGGGGGES
jgi:hypothetical protein